MKAVVFKQHGEVDQLTYADVPEPKIGANEILVHVRACALNHLDIWTRLGIPGVRIPLPHISGCDIAGEISAVGANVKKLKKGDKIAVAPGISCGHSCQWCDQGWDSLCNDYRILGFQVDGGYAEYVRVPARNAIPISDRYSYEEWASLPLVSVTAWHMLVTRAELKKGETVLIHAAGSGVSAIGIQLAKHLGARVITTVGGEEKIKQAKALGADHVINYKKSDFSKEVLDLTKGEGAQVVLEHIGVETFEKSLASLSKKGRLVTCGVTSGAVIQMDLRFLFMRQQAVMGCYMGGRNELEQVLALAAKGVIKPVVDQVFPLKDAQAAQQRMLDRKNFGKIILAP
jgi:NADPH:quinone reductase-like Zn-dependent oxidoreductase